MPAQITVHVHFLWVPWFPSGSSKHAGEWFDSTWPIAVCQQCLCGWCLVINRHPIKAVFREKRHHDSVQDKVYTGYKWINNLICPYLNSNCLTCKAESSLSLELLKLCFREKQVWSMENRETGMKEVSVLRSFTLITLFTKQSIRLHNDSKPEKETRFKKKYATVSNWRTF